MEKDLDPLQVFEQEPSKLQDRIEQRMKDLERKIESLKKRLEKERIRARGAQGPRGKVIERSSVSEIQMRMGKDGVRVEIKEKGPDGKMKKRVYEDKDLQSLLRAHPELRKKISVGGGLGLPGLPKMDFDFDFDFDFGGHGFPKLKGLPMQPEHLRELMEEMRRMFGKDFPFPFEPFPQGGMAPRPPKAPSRGKDPVRIIKGQDGVRVELRTPNGSRVFEGKSLEELLRKHPELKGVVKKGKALRGKLEPEFRGGRVGTLRPVPPRHEVPRDDGPKLGIYLKEGAIGPALREYLDLPEGAGLWVQRVVPGSLAERLGMREKDILVRLNGQLIKGPGDVARVLRELEDDAPVKAEVVRRGREVVLKGRR